jgi:DNA-binding response OmpR family regulator
MNRILIIEDEPTLRRQMARLLKYEGFEVLEADGGNAGVAAAGSGRPDLIICDIMMPDLDGFGVLQALRNRPQTAMIPFIFLTALAESRSLRHGMEQGADDYLTKPYTPAALLGSVRRRLEKRQRQLEESRQRAEEVSLAVAAALPAEILETLEHITTVTNLLALRYAAQDPQVEAMQQSVARETLRLRRLMRRLHLYAQLPRLYARRFELAGTGSPAAAEEVVTRVAREAGQSWNRAADLVMAIEPAALPLGEEYLAMLVEELVDNACKFSAPGTPINIQGARRQSFWSLAVSNCGPGLEAEQIRQIGAFKQFLHGNQKPRGLGLGLALTQGIARLHGCEFALQSAAETTTATVLVPLEA